MSDYQFPLDEYCARVGVQTSGRSTADRLEEFQRAQLYTIPFENLDIHLKRGIDLAPSIVDEKVIRNRRGGYCFELNGLFLRALREAGFVSRPLLARVHITSEPTGRSHQLSLVTVDGRDWVVDVGFGAACPRVPMPLEHNATRDHDGVPFRLVDDPLGYMLQKRQNNQWMNLYSFDLCPVVPNDIAYGNHYTSTSPRSFFTRSRVIALCHPDGETRLLDYRCSTARRGDVRVELLPDSELYLEEVNRRFGIQVDANYAELRPVGFRGQFT